MGIRIEKNGKFYACCIECITNTTKFIIEEHLNSPTFVAKKEWYNL